MRVALLGVSLVIGIVATARADSVGPTTAPSDQTTGTTAPAKPATPPKYTVSRWDESYGYLSNPDNRTDFLDPLKFVPLDQTGDIYATFGGQVRDRYEYFNHNLFGDGPQTRDGYNLARITENMDLHIGPDLRVFLQGASAFETGRDSGPRPPDRDELDLEQGFGEFTLPICDEASLVLRAGRQYLQYGAERLIGPADWLNARHNFDGFRADLDSPDNGLDFFIVRPVLVEPYKFDSSDDKNALVGLYDTLKLPEFLPESASKLEVYALYLDRLNATVATLAGTGTEDVYTLGTRFTAMHKPFDFDVEGDYQLGSFLSNDINAYSFATKDGFTFAGVPMHPRAFIGFDIASGGSANSGTVGTFNQLYPSGHGQFGNIDAIGRQNIIDVNPGLDLTLLEHLQGIDLLKLRISYYEFWRESLSDAVYTASGTILRAAGTSRDPYVGDELDFLLNWQIDRHLASYFGYSHFFPGGFIRATGPNQGIDFFYMAVTYTF
jgi:hypothetical protein